MERQTNRQTRIFDRLSRDLSSVVPDKRGVVLCPLCMKAYRRDEVGALSRDHIIPRSLGGKVVTLTCKTPCNNDQGHQMESHLVEFMKAEDAFEARSGSLRGRVSVEGIQVPMDFHPKTGLAGDPNLIRVRNFDPAALANLRADMAAGVKKLSLTLSLGYVPSRLRLAIARVAYLSLFQTFGYRYILSGAAQEIRKRLQRIDAPDERLFRLATRIPHLDNMPISVNVPVGIIPLEGKAEVPGLLVLIWLQRRKTRCVAALMPTSQQNPATVFDDLWALAQGLSGKRLTVSFPPRL